MLTPETAGSVGTLFEQLQSMLAGSVTPSHLNVGEAYVVHQNLTAYYYLRSKCALFEHHSQSPDLKAWWHDAREKVAKRIPQLEAQLDKYGVPRPPSLPVTTDLTDQFMALDGMAMVRGMLLADVISIQSALHPDVATLHKDMYDNTLKYGASLMAILERQGWMAYPPTYEANQSQAH